MLALIDRQTLRIFRQRMAVLHRGAMMRRFVESSFDGIIVTDPQGHITIFNQAVEEMLGYEAKELMSGPSDKLFDFSGDGDDTFTINSLLDLEASPLPCAKAAGCARTAPPSFWKSPSVGPCCRSASIHWNGATRRAATIS